MLGGVDDRVHVGFAADNNVAKGLAAAMRSTADRLAEAGRAGSFAVVDCGVAGSAKSAIERSLIGTPADVRWLPAGRHGALLRSLSSRSSRPYPASAYARLLLPGLLPDDVHRIIYLDADVVVRHDPTFLWDEPMGDDVLFAVADLPHDNGNAQRIARTVDQTRYPYSAAHTYFQSGVLVMDIARMRRERIAERAFAFLAEYPTMQFPDQDALNALLADATRLIDPRWNQMAAVYRYEPEHAADGPFDAATLRTLQSDPFVVHYSGRPKPWERDCRHPLLDDWNRAIDRTAWRGWRPNALNATFARARRMPRMLSKRVRALPGQIAGRVARPARTVGEEG